MDKWQAEKKFPSYFVNFQIPEWAREQKLEVYRACRTGKVERESFLNCSYGVPFVIAKGVTNPVHGICLETKEWKRNLGIKYKGSHVDWWLYADAEPYIEFEVIDNEH